MDALQEQLRHSASSATAGRGPHSERMQRRELMKEAGSLTVLCIAAILMCGCGQGADRSNARQAEDQTRLPIIDMHMHAFDAVLSPDGIPIPVGCEPQPCEGTAALATSSDAILEMTLEQMEKYNVVKGLLSSDISNLDR